VDGCGLQIFEERYFLIRKKSGYLAWLERQVTCI
jgi:hypothetical protein